MPQATAYVHLAAFPPFPVAEIRFSSSPAKTTEKDAQWIPDGWEKHALSSSSPSSKLPQEMQF